MAERRMFTKKITESDAFLDMPTSSQALYFHLSMNADDDGFVNSPKKIQRQVGASDDDMKLLLAKSFILSFESGVIVIKHWKMHNYIQKDRYKPTDYIEEKSMLSQKKNGTYTYDVSTLYPNCIQDVSIGKDRLGKDRLGEDSIDIYVDKPQRKNGFEKPTLDEVKDYIWEKGYHVDAEAFMAFYESNGWKVGKNPMKSWQSALVTWEKREKDKPKPKGTIDWENI